MDQPAKLDTELSEGILTITLSNPATQNTLSGAGTAALRQVIQEVYDNDKIKSVLLTGTGETTFATGTQLAELQTLDELHSRRFAEQGQETMNMIEACHKPILAAINGTASSTGLALALACHLRTATENATLSFPDVAQGLIPTLGSTQRLTHLVGKAKALELMMTGEVLNADAAKALGIVSHVVSYKEALIKKSRTLLQTIMAQDPLAIGMLISCINAAHKPKENGQQIEANSFAHCCKAITK